MKRILILALLIQGDTTIFAAMQVSLNLVLPEQNN